MVQRLNGSVPGLLDPTQPDRLLRLPGSTLLFASFDPLTATNLRHPPLDPDSCRPKRVVVETTPDGDSFWRYVPNARLEEGLKDEGGWPRTIDICGRVVECSQEQWDIYKLDPLYVCHVRVPPRLTQITRITDTRSTSGPTRRKRPASQALPEDPLPASKQRVTEREHVSNTGIDVNDENTDGFEPMAVDEAPQIIDGMQGPPLANHKRYRAWRRTWGHSGKCGPEGPPFAMNDIDDLPDPLPEVFQDTKKRKLSNTPEDLPIPEEPELIGTKPQKLNTHTSLQNGKRARTVSPPFAKRLNLKRSKRLEREQSKKQRWEESLLAKRQMRDEIFFESLVEEPAHETQEYLEERESPQPVVDEEQVRQTAIEESRRKIADLEADKPIWEAAAKQRLMREKAEEESIRVKVERSHRNEKQEAEREARIAQEAEKRRREEDDQRQREEAARRERERRRRQQQQRWAFGPWTVQRALERYKVLCEEFDSTKFSVELPLTMEAVPWPVLTPPSRLNVADVDWDAVEKFFAAVRNHMEPQDYRGLVERSHRRFHPDRWRSRSLLKTVFNETERDGMEVAANTVAQALTPLWRELTGR